MRGTNAFYKFDIIVDIENVGNETAGSGGRGRSTFCGVDYWVGFIYVIIGRPQWQASGIPASDRNTGNVVDKPEHNSMVPVYDEESDSTDWSLDLYWKVKMGSNGAHKSS